MLKFNEEEIFRIASKIDSKPLRDHYLNQICGDDNALLSRLRLLLKADSDDSHILGLCPQPSNDKTNRSLRSKEEIKVQGFEIIRRLGEGGMGRVYLAEQIHPIRRKVALKVVGSSCDHLEAIRRFESEKQCLATLNHPNIASIYGAGSATCGQPYVAMEWIDGIQITKYCDDNRLSINERLKLFRQACDGIQHAHFKGIIHRDLKPSNILVLEKDHQAICKIIDFGIAKMQRFTEDQNAPLTQANQLMGTLEYMSPEQALTKPNVLDTRSDIYSLGVVLHELLVGNIPNSKQFRDAEFLGQKLSLICDSVPPLMPASYRQSENRHKVANQRKTTPAALTAELEDDLQWIVAKTLEKKAEGRYTTVRLLSDDIDNHLENLPTIACPPSITRKAVLFSRRHPRFVTISMLTVIMIVMSATTIIYAYNEKSKRRTRELQLLNAGIRLDILEEAQEAKRALLPGLRQHIDEQRPVAAFLMARSLENLLKEDPDFQKIQDELVLYTSFTDLPPGTSVKICDSLDDSQTWTTIGKTPLVDVEVPNGLVRVRLENQGYVSRDYQLKDPFAADTMKTQYLVPEREQRENMVWIHGNGDYVRSGEQVLQDFWIDRFEVSNTEYQDFVDAGAYTNPRFWSGITFRKDGEEIEWSEAMDQFRDLSGKPGPSNWKEGRYPKGMGQHPVSGVSWYEANAYAAFRSKRLPTIHHWSWAASTDQPGIAAAQNNFASGQAQKCGQASGIGRFDARDMAGNASEWCWNEDENGARYILGGDWKSQEYSFSETKVRSPWDRSLVNGFRCSFHSSDKSPGDELLAAVPHPPDLNLEGERKPFDVLRAHYLYDRNTPLAPKLIANPDQSDSSRKYHHEIIEITAAYDQERFNLHLFIPKGGATALETLIFVPGVSAWEVGRPFQPEKLRLMSYVTPLVENGRVVCFPIYEGTYERWRGNTLSQQFQDSPIQARKDYIKVSMDVSRAVDYMLTREEVDPERLVYFGLSNGAIRGPMCLSTEKRLRAGILLAGGYTPWHKSMPEIQPYQFTPHVKQPMLMINGTGDQVFPLETSQKTLFRDLGSEKKKHVLFPAEHLPNALDVYNAIDKWLTNEAFTEN